MTRSAQSNRFWLPLLGIVAVVTFACIACSSSSSPSPSDSGPSEPVADSMTQG